ncbi:MAG: NUDIX domain-containing protein, partial [Anaerolineales bacterium]
GLGGHVERGEAVHAAAEREIYEEAGLRVAGLRLVGVVTIDTTEPVGIGLFVFTAQALARELVPSAEGTLEWVPASQIAKLDLVEDLLTLLPRVLALPLEAPTFSAQYTYDTEDKLAIKFFGQ